MKNNFLQSILTVAFLLSSAGIGYAQTGSGTTNYVTKWTGSTTLGDSQIKDDGSLIGIPASVSPQSKVTIENGSGIGLSTVIDNIESDWELSPGTIGTDDIGFIVTSNSGEGFNIGSLGISKEDNGDLRNIGAMGYAIGDDDDGNNINVGVFGGAEGDGGMNIGVFGGSTGDNEINVGVFGTSDGADVNIGVRGIGEDPTGTNIGVLGEFAWTTAGNGIGVLGLGVLDPGPNGTTMSSVIGVQGQVEVWENNTATQAVAIQANFIEPEGTVGTGIGVNITNVYGSSQYGIYQQGSDDDNFFAGYVGIGTTDALYRLHVHENLAGFAAQILNDGDNQNRNVLILEGGADDGSGTTVYVTAWDGDGGEVGRIEHNSGTFQLVDVSDARTKINVQNTTLNGLDIINKLRVVDFNRKENPDGKLLHGFIAQEVQEVFPYMVSEPQNGDGYLGIAKSELIPVLVKAIQEQQALINAQETKNSEVEAQLRNEIAQLKLLLNQLCTEGCDKVNFNNTLDQGYYLNTFPNPADNTLQVSYSITAAGEVVEVELTDLSGKLHKVHTFGKEATGNATIDVSQLPAGNYYVTLKANGVILQTNMISVAR